MKIPHLEHLARRMREDHRHHPWSLSAGGLWIPHSYEHSRPDKLSHWDDVGFILNGRRFMVWWRHPRDVYRSAIEDLAWQQHEAEHGDPPDRDWLFDGATTIYKKVGKFGKRKTGRFTIAAPILRTRAVLRLALRTRSGPATARH